MGIMVLLINYDKEAQNLYIPLLAGYGVTARAAPGIRETLAMLAEADYSGIVINADNGFDYLPLLKVMRKMTAAPIGVSVSYYDPDENRHAIENGADIYRVRYDRAERRTENFSNLVKIYVEYSMGGREPMTVLTYDGIQIFPRSRKVLVMGEEVSLLHKEFELLLYLAINKGIILTHEQLYLRVWGEEYPDNARGLLWNQISRLRGKLKTDPTLPDFIITKRNYGYSFNPRQKAV